MEINLHPGDRVRTQPRHDSTLPAQLTFVPGTVVELGHTTAIVKLDPFEQPVHLRIVDLATAS